MLTGAGVFAGGLKTEGLHVSLLFQAELLQHQLLSYPLPGCWDEHSCCLLLAKSGSSLGADPKEQREKEGAEEGP